MRSLLLVLSVVQDSPVRAFVRMVLESLGHRVIDAAGYAQAESLLTNGLEPDLVLYDSASTESARLSEIQRILQCAPRQQVCLVTKVSEGALREKACELGVRHQLTKPLTRPDIESLIDAVSYAGAEPNGAAESTAPSIEIADLAQRSRGAAPTIPHDMPPVPFIEELGGNSFFLAASPKMLEIHRQVKLLADIDVNVLLLGESGTGKEIVAQLIHKNSRRSHEKFLKVNCAALPAELLESELFGHRQGAFTGAINDRAGKFEQANRGTLLLDEIGEIGVQMQAKLLHVLQDGQFARLGAQETTKVDVRVLAATNIQMEDALFDGKFREDLYYRLSVFTIKIPPLRERREEIPCLIEQFIRRAPAEMRKGFGPGLPSRLMDTALLYDWRGNLRELRNFVTRTMVMRDADGAARGLEAKVTASASDEAEEFQADAPPPCAGIRSVVRDLKDRTEAEMIRKALEVFGWNRRRAAQYLNISYRGLLYKIQQHHLRPWVPASPEKPYKGSRPARQNAV